MQELEDISEEQQAVELLRTNEGLITYITTQKDSRGSTRKQHSIKIQGYVNFWMGSFL